MAVVPQRRRRSVAPKGRQKDGAEPEGGKVDRTKWLHEQTVAGVEKLATEGGWKAWCDMKARLHKYSFGNTIAILMQDPDATMVAGYTDWTKKFGRKVLSQKDGGQPLYIWAPHTRWFTEVNETTGKEERVKKTGFHATHCYDVKSTTGPELPPAPTYSTLEGDAPRAQWDALMGWMVQEGYVVNLVELPGGLHGDTSPKGIVRINSKLSPIEQLATAYHEAAHIALGHIEDIDLYRTHRGTFEVEAESTAYIVMTAMGLDVGDTSFEYIAGWAQADPDRVAATAEKVCKVSDKLLDALAPDLEQEIEERARFMTDREEIGDVVAFEIGLPGLS